MYLATRSLPHSTCIQVAEGCLKSWVSMAGPTSFIPNPLSGGNDEAAAPYSGGASSAAAVPRLVVRDPAVEEDVPLRSRYGRPTVAANGEVAGSAAPGDLAAAQGSSPTTLGSHPLRFSAGRAPPGCVLAK